MRMRNGKVERSTSPEFHSEELLELGIRSVKAVARESRWSFARDKHFLQIVRIMPTRCSRNSELTATSKE